MIQMKRTPSDEKKDPVTIPLARGAAMPFLPPDHPHSQQRVLGEIESNHNTAKPRRGGAEEERPSRPLHKRTKSAVSLRSLGKSKEEKAKDAAPSSSKSPTKRREKEPEQSPLKKKSTTSLTSMFKSKSSKEVESDSSHSDKENSTPPKKHIQPPPISRTPIYAQFATQQQEVSSTTKVPLNDREKRQSVIEQIALYDPDQRRMDESKQRNFHGYDPRLSKPIRPKSEVISNHELGRFIDNPLQRKLSNERRPMSYVQEGPTGHSSRRPTSKDGQISSKHDDAAGGSRVKDVVSRINRRTLRTREEVTTDPKKFIEDFDAMLVSECILST
jgi:hypothetical protein